MLGTMATNVSNLADQVTALAQTVSAMQSANSGPRKVSVVEKPATFKGKDSESARLFRNAFYVWAEANKETFAEREANGRVALLPDGRIRMDSRRTILSAMSFMTEDAALWARPHIESAASGQPVFGNFWAEFIAAFQTKFEPVDATADAKNKL